RATFQLCGIKTFLFCGNIKKSHKIDYGTDRRSVGLGIAAFSVADCRRMLEDDRAPGLVPDRLSATLARTFILSTTAWPSKRTAE
ncbi:hypothetical protein, partial [Mesorhizobium sp.]|uniref:hypothetical protein n=1 Tax=Mesorhizobium sp. TaxID=1871066 RepID=UPI0025F4E705